MLAGYCLLESFDLRFLELHNSLTSQADQVVVMLCSVTVHGLELRRPVGEVAFGGDPGFDEQLHCTVDRRVAYPRIHGANRAEKFVNRDVFLGVDERAEDDFPLLGGLEATRAQVRRQALLKGGDRDAWNG